ncbi:glycosyltransferase [Streptomyces sp. JNUCC 64]
MRVLLSTYGSRGDVEPLVGLAVRVRELGAEVRVCAPPDEEFVARLADAGVPVVPVGWAVRPMVTGAVPPPDGDLPRRAAEWVTTQFAAVAEAAKGCDVVVGAGMMPVAEPSVAERLGVPYVYATYQPVTLPSPYRPPLPRPGRPFPPEVTDNLELWDLDARDIGELFGPALNAHRESLGLPPVDRVRDHFYTGQPWLAADPVLSPWRPTGLDVVQTGAWTAPDGRPLPVELEEFLAAGGPPVYVGFGSMPMRAAEDVARVAVEAVRGRGRRVVLARGWAGLSAEGGDDVLVVGEVNQQALFGRVAAVVHHGGAGTTTTAARAGAPQVVVAQAVDQPYWADRVAALGIGAAHDGPVPTVGSLSAALGTALDPGVRARARAVAGTVRTDGAAVAARLLLDEARRGGRRRPGG